MNKSKRLASQVWLTGATASLTVLSTEQAGQALQPALPAQASNISEQMPLPLQQFAFHRENILGTSFELQVNSIRPEGACVCEQQVLAEIERLRLILSTYDPASEISRVRAGAQVKSPELKTLLSDYALWAERTNWAISVSMGEVIRLWKAAKETAPSSEALARASSQLHAYNVDALGKGFIIDRSVEVAQRFAPSGLLNIGGDIRVWGDKAWQIGVANPSAPAENAPLLGGFVLRNGAVATSGGYSRFVTLNGQRYSHIIDPRTLQSVNEITSASIVAANCLTANALSTAASILGLGEGVRLARLFGAWEYLLVDSQGRTENSFALTTIADTASPPATTLPAGASTASQEKPTATAAAPTPSTDPTAAAAAWPTNFQISINLNLKPPTGGRGSRPYVAVWVQDSNTNLVRTITVWGSQWRWLQELNTWWKVGDKYTDAYAQSITRATRAPGNYVIAWDGLNDKKQPVPQGKYKIFLEINREHGRHVTESATIECGKEEQSAEIRATPESGASKVDYGPKFK